MGQGFLAAVQLYDESMRELHRPLTGKEKMRIEALINESENCPPDEEDLFIIHKTIDAFRTMLEIGAGSPPVLDADEDDEMAFDADMAEQPCLEEIVFQLGASYERLKSKGLL